jgi:hypothetical protein
MPECALQANWQRKSRGHSYLYCAQIQENASHSTPKDEYENLHIQSRWIPCLHDTTLIPLREYMDALYRTYLPAGLDAQK